MSDLGVPTRAVLIAKADVGIEEQMLVLDRLELRLMELEDETDRIKTEQKTHEAAAKEAEARAAKPETSPLDARRATISAREHRLINQRLNVRLLEIDDERRQTSVDEAASRAHIANLEAEKAQQTALKRQET